MKNALKALALGAGIAVFGVAHAQSVDMDVTGRIRAEAFQRSQVLQTLNHLTDVIGPRLTNSPSMYAANAWTRQKFNEWGL